MRLIPHDKEFYRLILKIALPISLQNLITFLVGMMDTVMLGKLGEVELSASSLANQLFFIFMISGFGLANGANILIAQYWGKRDIKTIRRIFAIIYKFSLVLGLLFGLTAFFFPEAVMSIYTKDRAVIEQGVSYLRIVAPCYLFYCITSPTLLMLRSVHTVSIALVVNITSLFVNVFFNWVFIFGNLGAPAMGVAGAAVGTLIARFCEVLMVVIYMAFFEGKVRLSLRELLSFDKSLLPDIRANVLPVTANEVLWSTGASAIAVVVGRMGTAYVAANSISSVLNQLVTVVIFGMASAAAVIIGNTIGQGDMQKTRERAGSFMTLAVIMGVIAGTATFFARPLVLSIYNVSDETKAIAMQIMAAMSIVVFFQSIAATSMMGVLRGGGDARFVMIADVIFLWTMAVPLGSLCGLVLRLPVWLTFFALRVDEVLKCIAAMRRLSGESWMRDVTH